MTTPVKPYVLYRLALTLVVLVLTVLAFAYATMGDQLRQAQLERDAAQAQLRAANAEIGELRAMQKPEPLAHGTVYDLNWAYAGKHVIFGKGIVPTTHK